MNWLLVFHFPAWQKWIETSNTALGIKTLLDWFLSVLEIKKIQWIVFFVFENAWIDQAKYEECAKNFYCNSYSTHSVFRQWFLSEICKCFSQITWRNKCKPAHRKSQQYLAFLNLPHETSGKEYIVFYLKYFFRLYFLYMDKKLSVAPVCIELDCALNNILQPS